MKTLYNAFTIDGENKSQLVKSQILRYYINNGSTTITDLSKELNLSIPTTTKLVNEMCKAGFVKEYGKLDTNEGRRPNLYGVNPESGYFVGVDIKHNSLDLGLMNFQGKMVSLSANEPYCFENTPEALDDLCNHVIQFIGKQKVKKDKILCVNMNISGRVDPKTGYSHSIFNFTESPLAEVLTQKVGFPVHVDNDSRAMAYGEYMAGCEEKEKNVIFINVSWGLGMGLIINGQLYGGKSGFAGEIGHIHTFNNEILCHCGKKGCLETEVSGIAFHRIVKERIANGETSILIKKFKDKDYTLDDLIEATNEEDVLCIDTIEEIGTKLGESLASLVNIFNPDVVIIGGVMSLTGDYLLQPVKTAMRKYSLNLVMKDTKVCLSKLREKAGVIGACMLARNHVFEK